MLLSVSLSICLSMCLCLSVCLCICLCVSVCADLQINNVTPVMELKEQLVGKKLSDQILK